MKNKVFERGSSSFVGWRAGSECPFLSGGLERSGWNMLSSLDGQLLPHLWVCSCWLCEQQRGWPSRVDLINEQSWLPPPLRLWWESASQVKHGEYVCSHEGHCNTICWCRLAWLWSGGTWEMWTLAQARADIIQRSPGAYWGKSVALPRPPLPAACWADCFERSGWRWWLAAGSGADSHWKRKWDPQWERQFFGGRVCFNAGLSCTAVLAHCYWQHWSLERCLTLPIVPFRTLSYLLCAAEHAPCCSCSEIQQLSPLDRGATARLSCSRSAAVYPARQSALLPPQPTLPAFLLLSRLVSLSSRMHPALGSHPQ